MIEIEKEKSDVVDSSNSNKKEVIVEAKSASVNVDVKKWEVNDTLQDYGLIQLLNYLFGLEECCIWQ